MSFGLAFAGAIMLATLLFLFTSMSEDSTVLNPQEQQQVANALEDDAQVMSSTQLDQQMNDNNVPQATRDEIQRINNDARPRALQVALLIPLIAGLLGLGLSFRMKRLPEITPSASLEGVLGG